MSQKKAKQNAKDPPEDSGALIAQLDAFLDQLAEGHRQAMEAVVKALTERGGLEREIQESVAAIQPIFQKWGFELSFLLRMKGTMRFNELKEALRGIGSRTLSERLKSLEAHGFVRRVVHAEVPVRVEYSLTPMGMRFGELIMPAIAHLRLTHWREGRSGEPSLGAGPASGPPDGPTGRDDGPAA